MKSLSQLLRTPLVRIALLIAGLIVIFFSGLFPLENLLSMAPQAALTASVVPADVASLTNAERVNNGLAPLSVNPLLTQAAQEKADDMAENSYYAHTSPDGKTPLYWFNKVGYKYLNAGENLVIDRTSSAQAVDAWMNSPEHRENILRPQFTEFGIGVAAGHYKGEDTIYVVQEFGTPYPLSVSKPTVKSVAAVPVPVAMPSSAKPTNTANPIPTPAPVAEPSIVTAAAKYVAPIVRALTPRVPSVATSSVRVAATTTAATTLPVPVLASIPFTLAPEFFTSVSLAAGQGTTGPMQEAENVAAPRAQWFIAFTAYTRHITAAIPRVW